MIKKLLVLVFILAGLIGGILYFNKKVDMVTAHIFIHGTRLSGFSFLSAVPTFKNELKDHHFYTQVVTATRNDERFYDSQIMLAKGLVHVPQETLNKCCQLKLATGESRKAAIQILSGYDTLIRQKRPGEHVYYTFGWDGLLSDENRRQESLALYNALIDLREQLKEEFPGATIKIILHGHSHGGNVILYLGLHENELKKNLAIDTAVLYGTPIQVETACFCQHPLFKKIINIYSEGDKIQVADKFSTHSKSSKRTFASVIGEYPIKQEKRVVELCVSAAGNKRAFSHASLYFLGLNGIGITTSVDRVFKVIKPLPVILFAPLFLDMLDNFEDINGVLNFERTNLNACKLVISSDKQKMSSCNLVPLIKPVQEVIEKSWKPYAIYGYAHLGGMAVADLFKSIPQYTRYKDIKYKARRAAKLKSLK